MKFTAKAKPFLAALAPVARIAPSKRSIPILSCVLIDVRGDGEATAALVANDLDREAEATTAVRAAQAGAACLPATTLLEILKKLPADADFAVAVADGRATLTSGRSRFVLPVLPAEDFSRIGGLEFSASFAWGCPALHRALAATVWAVSTEETRYYLNGVFWHFQVSGDDGPEMRCVATDGHRLARFSRAAPAGSDGAPSVIVPIAAVREIMRRAAEADDAEARVSVGKALVRLEIAGAGGATALTTKLIDGTFPDYQRVVPTAFERHARIDREAFRAAIDLCSPVASARGAAMKFEFGDGRVAVSSKGDDTGVASTEAEADADFAPFEIGFNARYALEALGAFEGERLKIALNDPGSPALITDTAHPDLAVVLMPCRV